MRNLLLAALLAAGICGIFTLHGVLIDKMKPWAAFGASCRLLKANWKKFLLVMLLTTLALVALNLGAALLMDALETGLEEESGRYPRDYNVDPRALAQGTYSDMDLSVAGYRFACAFLVIGGGFLTYILVMLSGAYLLMRFTRCYLEYTRETMVRWPSRPKRKSHLLRVLAVVIVLVLLLAFTLLIAVAFDAYFDREEPVRIVAHRTGGVMAPENSLEGLELAIAHGCYASETDIQRTKDGHYIINHDDDFKRLTGVNRKPGDMTLEEVRGLVITDPATGATAGVATVEEMLDVIKGREKLFLELKGVSADRQMVDDVVKLIREKDCVEDVTLISLKYDIIDYAETQYPEFETGVLIFGGIGDVSRINCDLLILEEEMATDNRIREIHDRGKDVFVWTINTEKGMYQFLGGGCDGIITDQVEMAQRVREQLDSRSDLQILKDSFGDLWD